MMIHDGWDKNFPNKSNPLQAGVAQLNSGTTTVAGQSFSDADLHDYMRRVSAGLMERDGQLPGPLNKFVTDVLRKPDQKKRPPGRKGLDLFQRHVSIGLAVDHVVKTWSFKRTRNRHRASGECAVSIVKAGLAAGGGLNLSEDEIIKASDRYRKAFATILPALPKELQDISDPEAKAPEISDEFVKTMIQFVGKYKA